jgi:L-rhamnose mutarotase
MQRHCLALDLKKSPKLIAEYERYHEKIPEAIEKSIRDSGITNLEIYRIGTRLFMILEATDDFSFEQKAAADAANPAVQAWESLMWQFQKALPQAKTGEKWLLMKPIFGLDIK